MPTQVPSIEIHDENARIVKGFGTVDIFDKANERLPIEEFKRIMPIIMKRGGIVMNRHTNQPAGKILNYQFLMKDTPSGPREGVYLETEVFKDFGSDDEVWEGIKKGEIEGFSFGGKNNLEDVDFSKGVSQKTLKGLEGFEFSYVPQGCNQEATIEQINYIAKEDKEKFSDEMQTFEDGEYMETKIIAKDSYNALPRLIDTIKGFAGPGHLTKIVVEPDSDNPQEFLFDGDGPDIIDSISTKRITMDSKIQKSFAGYTDFEACERANQDKDDPAAFCAYLKEKVEKIEEDFKKENSQKKEDSTIDKSEKEVSDDKEEKATQSKDDLTLLKSDKKDEKFINNKVLNKNMAEEDKKPQEEEKKVDKVEEAPMAADTPVENPMEMLNAKMDKLIEILSTNKQEVEVPIEKKEEDKDEDKDEDKEVEKEGDGEEVKLPESEGEEVAQDKPAEGAKPDEPKANFLEKEGIAKIKEDMKADIIKELVNKKADTPRPSVKANDIAKGDIAKGDIAKTSIEANKMIKAAGLR